jgi:hypothetical protein
MVAKEVSEEEILGVGTSSWLHPGINFSCLHVEETWRFHLAAGSVIALVAGVPVFRPFFSAPSAGFSWRRRWFCGTSAIRSARRQRPSGWTLPGAIERPARAGGAAPQLGRARFGRPAALGA